AVLTDRGACMRRSVRDRVVAKRSPPLASPALSRACWLSSHPIPLEKLGPRRAVTRSPGTHGPTTIGSLRGDARRDPRSHPPTARRIGVGRPLGVISHRRPPCPRTP